MIFPKVSGENLEGRKFILPDDFAKEKNLLTIAFQREQQNDIDTWMPLVRRLTSARIDLAYYELPTISTFNPIFRWWVNSGMRSGIPDHEARITLYLDKQAFRSALELPDEEQIYVLLIDGVGKVLWRAAGPLTQEKEDELMSFLHSV